MPRDQLRQQNWIEKDLKTDSNKFLSGSLIHKRMNEERGTHSSHDEQEGPAKGRKRRGLFTEVKNKTRTKYEERERDAFFAKQTRKKNTGEGWKWPCVCCLLLSSADWIPLRKICLWKGMYDGEERDEDELRCKFYINLLLLRDFLPKGEEIINNLPFPCSCTLKIDIWFLYRLTVHPYRTTS